MFSIRNLVYGVLLHFIISSFVSGSSDLSGGKCVNHTLSGIPAGYDAVFCIVAFNHSTGYPGYITVSQEYQQVYSWFQALANPVNQGAGKSKIQVQGQSIYFHIDYIDIGTLSPSQTIAAANSVAKGNYSTINFLPDAIFTPYTNGGTDMIAQGIYNSGSPYNNIVQIGAGSQSDYIFTCYYNDPFCIANGISTGARRFPYLFGARTPAALEFQDQLKTLKKGFPSVEKIAVLYENEPYGRSVTAGLNNTANILGISTRMINLGSSGSTNVVSAQAVVRELMESGGVDAVFIPSNNDYTCTYIIEAFPALNYSFPNLLSLGICGLDLLFLYPDVRFFVVPIEYTRNLTGSDYNDTFLFPATTTTSSPEIYYSEYAATTGRTADYLSSSAFAAIYSLALAVNSLGNISDIYNPILLRTALSSLNSSTYYGRLSFDAHSGLLSVLHNPVWGQYDGSSQLKLVAPSNSAEMSLIYPRPITVNNMDCSSSSSTGSISSTGHIPNTGISIAPYFGSIMVISTLLISLF